MKNPIFRAEDGGRFVAEIRMDAPDQWIAYCYVFVELPGERQEQTVENRSFKSADEARCFLNTTAHKLSYKKIVWDREDDRPEPAQ